MLRKTMIITLAASTALLLGLAAPAMAETSPAVGMPPLTEWVFSGSNINPNIDFDYSGNVVAFPLNTNVSSVDAHWGGIDNPAPLLWYAKHVDDNFNPQQMAGDLGQMFAKGVKYSPALIATMNTEGFAPSMVGGYNPPGITVGTDQTASTSSPAVSSPASSSKATAHSSNSAASGVSASTTKIASPTAKAPGVSNATQPVTTAAKAQAILSQASTAAPQAVVPASGPLLVPPDHHGSTQYGGASAVVKADQRILHPAPKHWGHWVWAGAALAALLAALYMVPRIMDRFRSEY